MNVRTYLAISYFVERLFAGDPTTHWFWQRVFFTTKAEREEAELRRAA